MGTSLPTNVDASYADDPNDPSVVTHQKHHDAIHDFTNTHDGKLGAAAHAGLAIVSATAPASPVDNQLWYDTTAELMKRWDAAANAGAGAWKAEGNAAYEAKQTEEGFRAHRSTAQTLAAATFTKVIFDTEVRDQGADYDPTTGEWTCPAAGWWDFATAIHFGVLADGERTIVALAIGGGASARLDDSTAGSATAGTRGGALPVYLTLGQVVTIQAYRSNAGDISPGAELSWFTAKRRYVA